MQLCIHDDNTVAATCSRVGYPTLLVKSHIAGIAKRAPQARVVLGWTTSPLENIDSVRIGHRVNSVSPGAQVLIKNSGVFEHGVYSNDGGQCPVG